MVLYCTVGGTIKDGVDMLPPVHVNMTFFAISPVCDVITESNAIKIHNMHARKFVKFTLRSSL